MSQLDVIIPVYNEAENIKDLFQRLDKSLTGAGISYQVIFVDDHSTDRTTDEIFKLPSSKVKLLVKAGKKGKAYSILEGMGLTSSDFIVMIDGDLQYPPEAIPEMFQRLQSDPSLGVVVANRVNLKAPFTRRLFSKINRVLVGKMLLGFDCDIQSGLKMFKKEVVSYLSPDEVSGWSIDVPLLNIAHELGYKIGTINVDFAKRVNGETKVKFFETTRQIVVSAIKVRFSKNIA